MNWKLALVREGEERVGLMGCEEDSVGLGGLVRMGGLERIYEEGACGDVVGGGEAFKGILVG